MEVINKDSRGIIIKDLSKVTLDEVLSTEIKELISGGVGNVKNVRQTINTQAT